MMYTMRRTVLAALLVAATTSAQTDPVPQWQPRLPETDAKNLLPNSGFELGASGWSSLGETTAWGGDFSSLFGSVTDAEAQEGAYSLEVALGPGKTLTTYYDCWPAAHVVQHAPLTMNLGWITVTPGESYTLSAFLKADQDSVPARLVMRFGGKVLPHPSPQNREQTITLTQEWARYSFTFTAPSNSVCVGIGPDLRNAERDAATVWIDAVQFEQGENATDYSPRQTLEFEVNTDRFGNVFTIDEEATLRLHGLNRTDAAVDLLLTVNLSDYFGEALEPVTKVLRVEAGASFAEALPLMLTDPGYYRVAATAKGGGLDYSTAFPMAIIHEYDEVDAPFGVNHPPTTPELLEQFRRAGVLWARDWTLDWDHVEPEQGVFSWEEADRHIKRLEEADFQIMPLLPAFSSAKWAAELPQDYELPDTWRGLPAWAWISTAPKDPADLVNYIQHVFERYSERIGHWEFLNEPATLTALPSPFRGLDGYTYDAQDYLELLKTAHRAVKESDPDAQLVGGFSLEVLFRTQEFIESGGLEHLDIFNMHPYGFFEKRPEDFIPQMQEVLRLMDVSSSGRKPIWITETGYFAEDDKPWLPWVAPAGHFSAGVDMGDEKLAADHSIRHALIMLGHGVEKIFYHQGTDEDLNNGSMALENCFLGPLGTPQKLYPAQAYLSHLLGADFDYAGPLSKLEQLQGVSTANVHGFTFQCGDTAVMGVWAPREWQTDHLWSVNVPRDVEAFDIVGKRITEGGNGKSAPLGDSPIYLVTQLMPASALANAQVLRVDLTKADTP